MWLSRLSARYRLCLSAVKEIAVCLWSMCAQETSLLKTRSLAFIKYQSAAISQMRHHKSCVYLA